MANKFTRLIDKMFAEYSSAGTEDKILIAYFHKGDEDGGCGATIGGIGMTLMHGKWLCDICQDKEKRGIL